MDSNLLFNKAASFKLIRLHMEDWHSYMHSPMSISPLLIIRKIWLREAITEVQLQALLLLLFLQASAKMLSDFDTRHKHNCVHDLSVMAWPNSHLSVNMVTDTYRHKNIYGCTWSDFKNTLFICKIHLRNHHNELKLSFCVFSKRELMF